nr:hypothetical protein [Tanacetum cinerariifolium]
YSIDHQPLIIQQDLNLKLISDELMIEQRNELFKSMQSMFEEYRQREHAANLSTHTPEPSRRFNFICYDDDDDDDDKERTIPDVPEENVKIYSNPLFEFDDEYISSDVNPLFDEVLENIERKDSYDSNLDEPDLLVTPLSDVNEDKCFDPGGDFDEIDTFLDIDTSMDVKDGYHDSDGDIIYLESLLTNETIPSLPSEVFLDHDTKSLKDESVIDDSKNMVKIFDPGIPEKNFSLTYDCLDFEDSRARGFVLRSLELQSLAYGNPIS